MAFRKWSQQITLNYSMTSIKCDEINYCSLQYHRASMSHFLSAPFCGGSGCYSVPRVSVRELCFPWLLGVRISDTYHECEIHGGEKVPDSPLILRSTRCAETSSYLFNDILSPILNNSCKTVHPVVEKALHFIESEFISDLRNCLFNFTARVNLAIFFETPFNIPIPKSQKSQGFPSGESNGCSNHET
jgi:hypothetical protein